MSEIKDQLRGAMEAQGLSLDQLAEKAGISRTTARAAFYGAPMTFTVLQALADALQVTFVIEPRLDSHNASSSAGCGDPARP